MIGESWDVFTKRVLVENHISGIMYENPGGPFLQFFHVKVTCNL